VPSAIAAIAVAQLIQPDPPDPTLRGTAPMASHVTVPDDVERLLRSACYDCHSPYTDWPWYSRISPISWRITQHVEHGRSDLDFAHWATHPEREPTPDQRLRWICSDLRNGSMPPSCYRLLHPEARLTQGDIERICLWTEGARRELRGARGG